MAVALQVETILGKYRLLVDRQLRQVIDQAQEEAGLEPLAEFYGQMRYHFGWVHPDLTPAQGKPGKFLRPTLLLLAFQVCRQEAIAFSDTPPPYHLEQILPAAAAVELVHNFSLIHDDIEDSDPLRHNRPTLWKLWGQPQAINTGDGLFSLARLALSELTSHGVEAHTVLTLVRLLDSACLTLCEGQYLDMRFERQGDLSVNLYLDMIGRKTAALMRCTMEMGARLATSDQETITRLAVFGQALGLAFQLRDDLLGVWADEQELGKAPAGDIRRKKMSLPILDALESSPVKQRSRLQTIYAADGPASNAQIAEVLEIFDTNAVREHCQQRIDEAVASARQALEAITPGATGAEAWNELSALVDFLVLAPHRQV
ncbi:MAG TPA: polyprenyl synthetase family protein [Ktedonobacterales bacterium]|jgi:geranylgeranyl diphosphate synthase type I